jgi:hypothetical protein
VCRDDPNGLLHFKCGDADEYSIEDAHEYLLPDLRYIAAFSATRAAF